MSVTFIGPKLILLVPNAPPAIKVLPLVLAKYSPLPLFATFGLLAKYTPAPLTFGPGPTPTCASCPVKQLIHVCGALKLGVGFELVGITQAILPNSVLFLVYVSLKD